MCISFWKCFVVFQAFSLFTYAVDAAVINVNNGCCNDGNNGVFAENTTIITVL